MRPSKHLYKIGYIAKIFCVTPRTIRHYDQYGLFPHIKRSDGGIRLFDDKDIKIMERIRILQKKESLSLKEIKARIFDEDIILFHVTTPKKAKQYRESGFIQAPVRGFTTLMSAMAWAIKSKRSVIYKIESDKLLSHKIHKLPDHHNEFGEAWYFDFNVTRFKCVFSTKERLEKVL